jgi:hypothetical protein
MALQALSCTNCGSRDVIEVKPGTYFCNHCDTVFKYFASGEGSFSVCACGIVAKARCPCCRAAICPDCSGRFGSGGCLSCLVVPCHVCGQSLTDGYPQVRRCSSCEKLIHDPNCVDMGHLIPTGDYLVNKATGLYVIDQIAIVGDGRIPTYEHWCKPCAAKRTEDESRREADDAAEQAARAERIPRLFVTTMLAAGAPGAELMPIGVSERNSQDSWAPGPQSIRAWHIGFPASYPISSTGTPYYIGENEKYYVLGQALIRRIFGKDKSVRVLVPLLRYDSTLPYMLEQTAKKHGVKL